MVEGVLVMMILDLIFGSVFDVLRALAGWVLCESVCLLIP